MVPLGTKRISSHQVIGILEYLHVLRKPTSISENGASPQSKCFCFSLNAGLASTR